MIYLGDTIRQLTVNAQAIRAVVESISDEQAGWQPDANTWAMQTVLEHLYNEERGDFRAHLQEIFNDPPQPWGTLQPPWTSMPDFRQALAGFLAEREASIAWLKALPAPNWDATISASFGPQNELLVLSAGDLLVSWVAHDYLHLRQVNELLFAWNAHQAGPYKVDYAGGW